MKTTTKELSSLPLPPGNFGLPIIGETISFLQDSDFSDQRQEKYGPIFKTHIFGRPTVVMVGAEANRFLFANESKYFSVTWPKSTQILLGSASLSLQTGSFHASRRKLMYQAFQPRALASYVPTMEQITASYLEKWKHMGTLTWYPDLRNYTFDIASTLFVGTDGGSQTLLGKLFEEWCAGLFSLPLPFPWTKFGKALRCRNGILKEIEKIVLKRQQEGNLGEDGLGLLLQARDDEGNGLPLDELKDQVLLLLFAGHETLTSALASFCLLIGQHPEVLTRIRAEQDQLDPSKPLTTDTLKQMTYLEQVLKEVLRVVSPVGGAFRLLVQDCEFKGYLLPKGWCVQYQIGKTHEDERIYYNRERFDPDRFAPDRAEDKQQPFGYVPFGGGLRECLGKEFAKLEMKIFASMLVRDYDWELLPDQDLKMTVVPTPHPRDGLRVNFRTRKN